MIENFSKETNQIIDKLIKLDNVNQQNSNENNSQYNLYMMKQNRSKQAEDRCNNLHYYAKMKDENHKLNKEKAYIDKINNELSECTFKPLLINNSKVINKRLDFIFQKNKQKSNEINIQEQNKVIMNMNAKKEVTLYDKYKNKVTNLIAFRNKEIYIKKKIEGAKILKKPDINYGRKISLSQVLDNKKRVKNDKFTKLFINRLEKGRSLSNMKFTNSLRSYNIKEDSNINGKSLQAISVREFCNVVALHNSITINESKQLSNKDLHKRNLIKCNSLNELQNNLRSELFKIEL